MSPKTTREIGVASAKWTKIISLCRYVCKCLHDNKTWQKCIIVPKPRPWSMDGWIDLTALGAWYQSRRRRRSRRGGVQSQPATSLATRKKNWTKLYKCMYIGWRRRERGNERQRHKSWQKKKKKTQQQGPMKALHNILLSSCSCSYTLGFGFVCLFVCCLCVRRKCGVESWAASRGSTPVLFLLLLLNRNRDNLGLRISRSLHYICPLIDRKFPHFLN